MNKTKKNKTKKSTKKSIIKSKLDTDIVAILTIAIGTIVLFSLFSMRMGIVGNVINGTVFSLMGFGGYFFPFFIIGTGLIFILDRFNKYELKATIACLFIFFSFLIILDGSP